MSLYDDVEREARHDWLDERSAERARRDPGYDDRASLDEFRAELAREAAEEWRSEEEQTEAEDKARAERGERDHDWRA